MKQISDLVSMLQFILKPIGTNFKNLIICFNFSCFSYLEPFTLQLQTYFFLLLIYLASIFWSQLNFVTPLIQNSTKNVCESGLTLFVITQSTGFIWFFKVIFFWVFFKVLSELVSKIQSNSMSLSNFISWKHKKT